MVSWRLVGMRVVVLGAGGQVGRELVSRFSQTDEIVTATKEQVDVTDIEQVNTFLEAVRPDVVLNASAYMNADRCEIDPKAAYFVNTLGPRNVARCCDSLGAKTIWFSSDFVFDGTKTEPYIETDTPNPLGTYGISKWSGEREIRRSTSKHYIIRTSSIYGKHGLGGRGVNFIETMISKAKNDEILNIVDDVFMSPTYAPDLANMVYAIVKNETAYGTYHIANHGVVSWHDFCKTFLDLIGVRYKLNGIQLKSQPTALSPRPLYSALGTTSLPMEIQSLNQSWQDSLQSYLHEKRHI